MKHLTAVSALAAALVLGLVGCGNGTESASPTPVASPPPGFTVEAQYTEMCAAFDELTASPQAAVLANDSASESDIGVALSELSPRLQTFVDQFGSVMPAEVATDFSDLVTEIDTVAALNDNSSFTDATNAIRGLVTLKEAGARVDSFTETTCGTSLGF